MNDIVEALKSKGIVFSHKPCYKASFIMDNGLFLNFEENKGVIPRGMFSFLTHNDLQSFVIANGIEENTINKMFLCTKYHAIRLNAMGYICEGEKPYIDLPNEELNSKQYASLLAWLDYITLFPYNDRVVIGNEMHFYIATYPLKENGYTPEEIIKEIRRLYANAQRPI